MTLKEMRDQVIQWLGLQEVTALDETVLVEQQLYLGTLDVLSRTRCTVRCIDLHTLADVSDYTLDSLIMSLVDIDDGRPRLQRDAQPTYGFTLIRSDILRVVPTPSENGELQVWAVKRPDRMTDDTDSPSDEEHGAIPEEYHDAIVTYALWKCSDYADDSLSQNGEYYRTLYEGPDGRGGRLSQIKVSVNKRGTARAPRMRVNLGSVSGSGAYY